MMMEVSLFCCADERRVAKEERTASSKGGREVLKFGNEEIFALYYAVLSFLL